MNMFVKTCKECLSEKSLNDFYVHPLTSDKRMARCKECIKRWRRGEHERSMARKIDNKRSKTEKRLVHLSENTRKFREENPEKAQAERLVSNYLRHYPNAKPSISSISWTVSEWKRWDIHLHHPDYKKPFEVIPCTPLEHKKLHSWEIPENSEFIIDLKVWVESQIWRI